MSKDNEIYHWLLVWADAKKMKGRNHQWIEWSPLMKMGLAEMGYPILSTGLSSWSLSFNGHFVFNPPCSNIPIYQSRCWLVIITHTYTYIYIWVWVNTYRYIFSGMNIHLPAILGFTRYQGFDPSPYIQWIMNVTIHYPHSCWITSPLFDGQVPSSRRPLWGLLLLHLIEVDSQQNLAEAGGVLISRWFLWYLYGICMVSMVFVCWFTCFESRKFLLSFYVAQEFDWYRWDLCA